MQVLRYLFARTGPLLVFVAGLLAPSCSVATEAWLWPLVGGGKQVTGTFLEARSGRFHSGVDLRTEGREGLPVVAPASGRVVRLKASPRGYGIAVYLRLPDGRTLVFAHLSRLSDRLRLVVERAQFRQGRYEQDLSLRQPGIAVARGEVLALSGSTGVGAPHLHVELRDPRGRPLDPLSVFELADDRVPRIDALRLVAVESRSRIEGDAAPVTVAEGDSVDLRGAWGLQIRAHDLRPGNDFRLAPRRLTLIVDGDPSYEVDHRVMDFSQSAEMELFYDRDDLEGPAWSRLYLREGLDLDGIRSVRGGRLGDFDDATWHRVDVRVADLGAGADSVTFFVRSLDDSLQSAAGVDPRPYDAEMVLQEAGLALRVFGPGSLPPAGLRVVPVGADDPGLSRRVTHWSRSAKGRWVALLAYEELPADPWVLLDGAGRPLDLPRALLSGDQLWRSADGRLEIGMEDPERFRGGALELRPRWRASEAPPGYSLSDWPAHDIVSRAWVHPEGVHLRAVALSDSSAVDRHRGWVLVDEDGDATWLGSFLDSQGDWGLREVPLRSGSLMLLEDTAAPTLEAGRVSLRVRDDEQRDVADGVRLARWPSFEVSIVEKGSGVDADSVRGRLDGRPWPLRFDPEEMRLACDFDRDPGPGSHRLEIELADRSGRRVRGEWTVQLLP